MTHITSGFTEQVETDLMILPQLEALNTTVLWLSEHQRALWTQSQLDRDSMFSHVCNTLFSHNYSETWNDLRQQLDPKSDDILDDSVLHLQLILCQQIQSLQQCCLDVTIQTLLDKATWLNAKNCFSSLHLKSCSFSFHLIHNIALCFISSQNINCFIFLTHLH